MRFFGRTPRIQPDWHYEAGELVASVVRFINDRTGRKKPTPEQYVLERKLIFLLDDVRQAVRRNDRETYDRLCGQIETAWIDLWDLRRGAFKHGP